MKKKLIIILALILIVVVGGCVYYFISKNEDKTENRIENKRVTISSDEKCIAYIYYDYVLGFDASRGYNICIYKDNTGYKYEIKSGKITIEGPSKLKTEGYGRLYTKEDIEKLNEKYEKKKRDPESFSIRYQIVHTETAIEYCELDELTDFLFN